MKLHGKVAVVTGAGAGIGRAIAERLVEEGAAVVAADIDVTAGHVLVETLTADGAEAVFVHADVAVEANVTALIATAVARWGSVDIMVNNAGINFHKPLLETTAADWDRVITVNLRGTFFGCQAAIRQMLTQPTGGCIINLSSVHSTATLAGTSPYAASKGGISALTRTLAIEFGAHHIRVNAVCPGSVATRIWDEALAGASDPEAFAAHWASNTALGRVAAPREVANLICWLCTDDASYVTGCNLFVDGGMTAMLTNSGA